MGKKMQNWDTSCVAQNKTNPSFKWGRMFHILDYHHWHYSKKVLANKKRREEDTVNDVEHEFEANGNSDTSTCSTQGMIGMKDKLEEHTNYSNECISSPRNTIPKTTPSLSSNYSSKSYSRATKIKKMIVREVTRRKSRHRRSSTCPVTSEIITTNGNNLQLRPDGVLVEVENPENTTCGLCSTMKIECQLGNKKQIDTNTIIQDTITQRSLYQKLRRSVSLQQSIVFLDKRPLTKSTSFPVRKKITAPDGAKQNDNLCINTHQAKVPRMRFKDLRQKIKHVIKESKKDRHIIAMDAVLHRVPYGQKVPEDDNCQEMSSDDMKSYRRQSPTLEDGCFDKYCHLFEATSVSKDSKVSTQNDELRVGGEKRLGQMFSSPNLQYFLSNNIQYGDVSLRMPNRRVMSFRESKGEIDDISNMVFEYRNGRFNENEEEEGREDNTVKSSMENIIDEEMECYHTQPTQIIMPNNTSSPIDDVEVVQEISLEGTSTTREENINEPKDRTNESFEQKSPRLQKVQVNQDTIEEFNYIRDILKLSGYLTSTEPLGTWYSSEHPVDSCIFIEFESCLHSKGKYNKHLLLFDLINEILVTIYERSTSYWCAPLSTCSRTHPMPRGYYILEEVWGYVNWYMSCSKAELDPSLDYITTRDLAKDDQWMNLQFDAECVGLEVEELVFEDLINEVTASF